MQRAFVTLSGFREGVASRSPPCWLQLAIRFQLAPPVVASTARETMKPFHDAVLFLCIAAAASGAQAIELAASEQQRIDAANASVLQACAAAPKQDAACPLQANFGLFRLSARDEVLDFKPGRVVPLAADQSYGWLLRLNKKGGKVRVLERFTLPEAPRTWGTGPTERVGRSSDSRTASIDVTLNVYDGVVYRAWTVAPGDPVGHHSIRVWVEDSPPLQFDFDVVRAPGKDR
jgi:hypothetical protein